jgi:hypothetical protein
MRTPETAAIDATMPATNLTIDWLMISAAATSITNALGKNVPLKFRTYLSADDVAM